MPNKCDILHQLHSQIASLLGLPIKKTFDPHMTLINTKLKDHEKKVAKLSDSYSPIKDRFILTLGKSDHNGQFTEAIHKYDV